MSATSDALSHASRQREATPGRPEDGPYPATVGEVADEVVAWIDDMADSGSARNLHREVLARLLPAGLIEEIGRRREAYVHDQVSRQLAHTEGEMTRAQIDDAEIAARMHWDDLNPGSARLRKIVPSVSRSNGDDQ
jgi:hypothetical protein